MLTVDPLTLGGAEESDKVGGLHGACDVPGGCLPAAGSADFICHPSRVDRTGVDDVGADTELGELVGGGKGDAVQGGLAGTVGEIAHDVVTGEGDDPSGAGVVSRPREASPELADEQPCGTGVDREVPVEAFHARGQEVQIALFAV